MTNTITTTLTANYTLGGTVFTVASNAGILVGMTPLITGVATTCVVNSVNGSAITVSTAGTASIGNGTTVTFGFLNRVTFSASRIFMTLGNRSYSFDTSTKSPSLNLGIIQ